MTLKQRKRKQSWCAVLPECFLELMYLERSSTTGRCGCSPRTAPSSTPAPRTAADWRPGSRSRAALCPESRTIDPSSTSANVDEKNPVKDVRHDRSPRSRYHWFCPSAHFWTCFQQKAFTVGSKPKSAGKSNGFENDTPSIVGLHIL